MKTSTSPLLFLSVSALILFSNLIANPLLGAAAEDSTVNPVLDVDGNEVTTNTDYYILPLLRPRGGLTLADAGRHNGTSCPLDVVQAPRWFDRILPLTFSPVTGDNVVRVVTDLNIKFSALTICVQSTVWKLDDYDESVGKIFVTTGGVEGNPGPETLSNWFKIENIDDYYKLVFCPSVCDFCRPLCGDLGIYYDENGLMRLAISDVSFRVMFKKADDTLLKQA